MLQNGEKVLSLAARAWGGFCFDLLCENLCSRFTRVETALLLSPLGVCNSQAVHAEAPARHHLHLTGSGSGFCSRTAVSLINCDFPYLAVPLSSLGRSGLFCDLSCLLDLRRVIDVQLFFFSCCGDGSDDFQSPYRLGGKSLTIYLQYEWLTAR